MNLQELVTELLEHARGMWRYRWPAIGTAWLISVAGWLYVYTAPDVYRATAKVFVDTNTLLRPLMEGLTATSNTINEVQLVSRAVLTRPNLERVAHETGLALRARSPDQMQNLITSLQEQVVVSSGGDNIFMIQYEDPSRDKARDVVAAVLDTFVASAIGNQGDDADVTERALGNEIEVHENRLNEAENRLARFKQENLGYMPGELGDYYNRLQAALERIAHTEESIRIVTERRDELSRQIAGEEPVFGIMTNAPGAGNACSRSGNINALRAELSELRVDFTDRHPRVVSLNETIAQLEEECASESAAGFASGGLASPQPSRPLEANTVYQAMRIQLSNAEVELAELRARLDAEQSEVAKLRRDVDKITQVEAQLKQLNRDYDVVQMRHQELLRRWEDLQAKKRLDPVTDNVQFQRIEPPFALVDPVGPNRPLLLAAVLVVSLGGGGGLAFALSQINPVFFTRTRLRKALAFPVIGSISMILTREGVARRRRGAVGWGFAVFLLLVAAGAAIALAQPASAWMRSLLNGVVA